MAKKPNILLVLTDDQGAWAMGCAGNKELKTPTIDSIAVSGIRMENFFCTSPVCSPARVSLFTGRMPSAHGVHDWLAKGHLNEEVLADDIRAAFEMKHGDMPFEYIWPSVGLKGDRAYRYLDGLTTFTEILAQNGYECALSGKWHMGDSATPQAGFSHWHTTAQGAENYMFPVVYEGGRMVLKHNCYVTDYITDNAINFLRSRDESRPFYLSLHYTAPHSPWAKECHPREFYDIYVDCPFDSIPNPPPHPWVENVDMPYSEWKKKPHPGVRYIHANYAPIRECWQEYRRESLTGYFAAVTAMDKSLGRVISELERRGLRENTLIIFTSDNGSNMGHHGIFGKGNGTYPMNMYDTSVKVPGIFSMPGTIPAGRVSQAMLSHYDIFGTVLDFAGIPYAPDGKMPGTSFADILRGRDSGKSREEVVVFDEYGPVRMIRTRQWKYVARRMPGCDELYDLACDPGEEHNLIDDPAYRPRVAELRARLFDWFAKYSEPRLDGWVEDVRGHGQLDSHSFSKGGLKS